MKEQDNCKQNPGYKTTQDVQDEEEDGYLSVRCCRIQTLHTKCAKNDCMEINWEALRPTLMKSALQMEGFVVPQECVESDCSKIDRVAKILKVVNLNSVDVFHRDKCSRL